MKQVINIFWFRRDLRLEDNHGLYAALTQNLPVLPIFIFDTNILNALEDKSDSRIQFIVEQINTLQNTLKAHGSALTLLHGSPIEVWKSIVVKYTINTVFTNRDYEVYAQQRDREIYDLLTKNNVNFKGYKDHVLFEKNEIVKKDGSPYTVFTPYKKAWYDKRSQQPIEYYPSEQHLSALVQQETKHISVQDLGFTPSSISIPKFNISKQLLQNYETNRDRPDLDATSKISPHLRFGTVSIRKLYLEASKYSKTYCNELIWRDFYSQVLYHFPHVVNNNFKPKYDAINWRNNEEEFSAWCAGKTGFPFVDAGMRQLNKTGWMHNRVRMITASFLCKDLLIDWRWGEAYFASKLIDYDLASNNGGWQWAAGTGTDAAPYFRIFNPTSQQQKFDPNFTYINRWIPEWNSNEYPEEIVNHREARLRALEVYKQALS